MCWKKVTVMSQRIEFIKLALQEGTNRSELCRRFNISRKTGYKFLNRYRAEGLEGLLDHSKRPINSPDKTNAKTERLILDLRDRHPAWGGRKIKRRLEDLGHTHIPTASTISAILNRNGRICPEESEKHKAWERFEAPGPNDLWQIDFKGYFPIREGHCHPLTILDDHSRYALCIAACMNERKDTVQQYLTEIFRKYGLPYAMLMDNGTPWGHDSEHQYTSLTVWLMRLDISVIHSRPRHPQTLGKDERFHRTLKTEVISRCIGKTIIECQKLFDQWRICYNNERPHESLEMNVPAKCYRMSRRPFPEKLPEIEYAPTDHVRKVQDGGKISFKNNTYRISKAFKGERVAIRPTNDDGVFDVYFSHHKIKHVEQR
jgi:transposase InsO family protein